MTELIWSPQAKQDYWQNIDYLLEKWTEKEAAHFINLVDYNLILIQKNPKLFQTTNYNNIRRAVITPQITLFYNLINVNKIEIVRLWNNYQDIANFEL